MDRTNPPADDLYRIETPERIALEYDVAGLGSRLLAAMVDTAILFFVSLLVSFFGLIGLAAAFAVGTGWASAPNRSSPPGLSRWSCCSSSP
jgi:hypothetical protein